MSICYVIGAAPLNPAFFRMPEENDYVICADGGYDSLLPLGVCPDLVVGDFDSSAVKEGNCSCEEVVRLLPEKDDTDMLSAVKIALSRGWSEFYFYGGLGGLRLDHTIANIQLLSYLLDHQARGTFFDGKTMVTMIENDELILPRDDSCYFSVFSFTGSCPDVTLEGVKYPLEHALITSSFPIGVSNEITASEAKVLNRGGKLLVMLAPKNPQ